MGFKSDIEIAQECTMRPIMEIAQKAGIDEKYVDGPLLGLFLGGVGRMPLLPQKFRGS